MIYKSLVLAQASGSTGGLVYSRNAGGNYVRARAKPTNPNTPNQQAVRDSMRILVDAWTNVLNNGQREAWNTYAFNTPTLNRLGDETSKTGQQMYIRANTARLQAGLTRVDAAPGIFDVGSFTPVIVASVVISTQLINFTIGDTDDWTSEDGSALLIYQGRPQNQTRNFGKGPYQLLGAVLGDNTTPPASPIQMNSLFTFAAHQRLFFKCNVTRADGRYSAPQRPDIVAL